MTRLARVVAVGLPHHVTQRGNNQQDVFFVDDDRRIYLNLLKRYAQHYRLRIDAYCLMTNHLHLIAVPAEEYSLAKALGLTHYKYARYINALHGRSGHLWQDRFGSTPMDESHYFTAVCYVERNPVRALMVDRAWDYSWSSAWARIHGNDLSGLLDLSCWPLELTGDSWKNQLAKPEDAAMLRKIRTHIRKGTPLGDDSFLSKLEIRLGRRIRPDHIGRPPKKKPRNHRNN